MLGFILGSIPAPTPHAIAKLAVIAGLDKV
jgi:hypothetical protein